MILTRVVLNLLRGVLSVCSKVHLEFPAGLGIVFLWAKGRFRLYLADWSLEEVRWLNMLIQSFWLLKLCFAKFTLVLSIIIYQIKVPLNTVPSHMIIKVSSWAEALEAYLAGERFLVFMYSQVHFHIAKFRELSVTLRAFIPLNLLVGVNEMLLHIFLSRESFTAVRAGVLLLSVKKDLWCEVITWWLRRLHIICDKGISSIAIQTIFILIVK